MSPAAPDVLSAFRRSEQAYHAQLTAPQPIAAGMAFCAAAFPHLPDANQIRDVLLFDATMADAYAGVEAHFSARQRCCLRWTLSSEQPAEPVERHLAALGWVRREQAVFGLSHWPSLDELRAAHEAELRILPARAMRKAHRQSWLDDVEAAADADLRAELADAANERLDDANLDGFVAVIGGETAGRVGLLEVGDICRGQDLYVCPASRGRGVATALLRHALQLAYRLRPRIAIASGWITKTGVSSDRESDGVGASRRVLQRFGFVEAGRLTSWERSGVH